MEMKINFSGGKKVTADYKGFKITTDQPVKYGGEESAPEPFSLFMASIGTCTGFYVLSFCQKRNIPTENITLTMNSIKNSELHMIEKINIEIHLPEDFPKNYENAIIKSASLCSVKKHLEKAPEIKIKIA